MQRVAVYIDGMNLYYGLRAMRHGRRGVKWPCYYWLDVWKMSEKLIEPGEKLVLVRYFTARVRHDPNDEGKTKRQNTYLEALETLPGVEVHLGYFSGKRKTCRYCGASHTEYEEKMTDVNIATELLYDAEDGLFDTAKIVSGDGDLAGPVTTILRRHPGTRVVMAFPPARHSKRMVNVATGYINIDQNGVRNSQLPARVKNRAGYWLRRPRSWD